MTIRTIRRIVLYSIAGGAAVVLLLLLLAHTPPVRRYVADRLEQAAGPGWALRIGELDYNLFAGTAEARGLTLGPGPRPFLTARRIALDVDMRALLGGAVVLEDGAAEGLAIDILVDAAGQSNVPSFGSDRPPSNELPNFLIRGLAAAGSFTYQDQSTNAAVRMPAWTLNLTGVPGPTHSVQFTAGEPGTVQYGDRTVALSGLRLAAQFTRSRVDVEQLALDVPGVDLTAAGSAEGFADPALDARLMLAIDLEPVLTLAGIEPQRMIAGRMQVEAALTNTLANLAVEARITGSGLTAAPVRQVALDARARWTRGDGIVQVDSARLQAPEGAVTMEASWSGAGETAANRASAQIERLDLARVSRLLELPVEIASGAAGTVSAEWRGLDLAGANGQANLRITPSGGAALPSGGAALPSGGAALPSGGAALPSRGAALPSRGAAAPDAISASGTISAQLRNRRATLSVQALEAWGASADATIATNLAADPASMNLSGGVQLRVPDLGATLAAANAFRGIADGATAGGEPVEGQGEVRAQLGGTLGRPTAALMVEGGGIRYGPLRDLTLTASAAYDPTQVSVDEARIAWNGSEIRATGSLALEGAERPLLFTAETTDISIPEVLGTLGYDYPIRGRVALQAQGRGTMDAPEVSAAIQGHDLEAYQAMLGELASNIAFAGRSLRVDALRLDKPDNGGTLTARGTFDLDTRGYTLEAEANQIALRTLELPGQMPVRGSVNLKASGAGTVDQPAGDFDLNVRDLNVDGRMLGEVTATGGVAGGRATLTADLPTFRVHAEAAAATSAPYPLTVRIATDHTDLGALPWGLEEPPVRGAVTATLEASGEPDRWQEGQASLEVAELAIETPLGEVQNEGPLRIGFANRTFELQAVALTGAGSRLSLSGSLPLDAGAAAGTVHYEGSADLAALAAKAGADAGITASGQVTLAGDLRGSAEHIAPSGHMEVRGGRFSAPALRSPLEKVEADVSIDGGTLAVERLQAVIGTGAVSGRGDVPLGLFPLPPQLDVPAMTQPARLEVALSGLGLDSLAALPEGVGGTVSLSVEAQTERPDLDAVQATITIRQAILSIAGARIQTSAAMPTLSLRDGILSIDQFALNGPGSSFELSGGASLAARELRGVQASGTINAGLLSALSSDLSADGSVRLQISAAGPFADPTVNGFVQLDDGRFSIASPRLDATGLNARIALQGERLEIERFAGDINGGSLMLTGGVSLSGGVVPDIRIAARDLYLDFPPGVQTRSSADLRLAPQQDNLLVSGTVTIHEGAYTEPLDVQTALQSYLSPAAGGVELVTERNDFLSRLRFDIAVKSEAPLVVDNNLGTLALTADLRAGGDYYRPALTGRIDIEEDGRLRLQENDYVIERGSITFINETRIEPVLDILANTQVRGRNISVNIATDASGDLTTNLTSDDPGDTQADILALLLTGKTSDELEGRQLNAAGERAAASLVAGSVTGRLSQSLQGGLGLSRVRIEPNLISQESDPTARLTIGQDLTRQLELIYSMNLRNSNDQIWITNYELLPGVNTRATKQSDNSYRFDFQHDLRFGSSRAASGQTRTPQAKQIVKSVQFSGSPQLPEQILRDKFKVKTGSEYDFFAVRKGLDRLESLYRDEGYLEARLRLHRQEAPPDGVTLDVEVQSGPLVDFVYEGWPSSNGLRRAVRDQWSRGVFDSQRIELSLEQIRRDLGSEGYLQPMLETDVQEPAEGRKRVLFTVNRGRRYAGAPLVFQGASGIPADVLKEQIKRAGLDDKFQSSPGEVRTFLRSYYRQEGYVSAEVMDPAYEFNEDQGTARIVIAIDEGPRYRFGEVHVQGVTAFTADELQQISAIRSGAPYTPAAAEQSRDRVEEEYWKKGYRDVVVAYSLTPDAGRGVVDLDAMVTEGRVSVVESVEVAGTDRTSEDFVRRQIALQPGDVLDYTKTVDARRQLYDTGAFSSVELRATAVENPDVSNGMKQVRLLATVQEPTPFRLRYGGFFDTDRGPGFITDFRNRNSLGGGRVIGFRTRYDNDVREGRVFFSQPLLRGLPLRTDAATFLRREFQRNTLEDGTKDVFITDRIGFSIQEGVQLQNKFFLTAGYRFEHAHTFDVNPLFIPFDVVLRVAPLTTSLTRDTRDELLDATGGSFTSHSFELSTRQLGSTLPFWRYFGQYFHYLPLTAPAPLPFGQGLEKPRVIYAGGVRVGLAKAFGGQDQLARSERFFAGGGTTIRGFQQDQVGELDPSGRPMGGEAALIINNEIRFPVASIFDAVGFVDLGNVFPKIGDFSLTDIRKTGGAGLRVRTPYFLLRLDYGFKLDRQRDEKRGALFFSIGQAF